MASSIFGWLALLFAGMPVGFSLIFVALAFLVLTSSPGINFAAQQMLGGINNFTLLAVPFFVLTGHLMNSAGITERIFNFAKAMVGHVTGSLGHVNIMASLLFSGMSGSALADAGGLGQLEIKSMRDAKYDDDFAGGLTAASCIIGPLVPPSIPLVIYGVVSNTSIGALFLAGAIPGLLCCIALMVMSYFICKKRGYMTLPKASRRAQLTSFKEAFLSLLTPVIIIGGIFSGKFTPTEAAVVSSLYALFLGTVVYKQLTIRGFIDVLKDTVNTTAVVALMVMGVTVFGWIVAREQLPQMLAEYFLTISDNPLVLLLLINLLLLFLGTFIESLALLLLLVPFLVPVASAVGIDPVHFGVMAILNLMIGILTPPMGMALYVVSRVGDIPFHTLTRGVIPLLVPLFIVLMLVAVFPQFTLFLPELILNYGQ
ncbi:putative TRAP-type transport system, large permease component, N-acetylneuraminate transporter [Vibrio nigripulchritudo SFn27]|uniref:TRAP transporter large permease protein n=1 Tax=Vibrio nigripulchritudo TaxID=28173 RepID=U4K876_9VIBR|nr:TRAP transporter large permease [Vibrio nigripulchritudo]CCN82300.1 putative TRAP-type transport system, large permease component, N-acetylneuraminate transporter [Vibrio nigripulchritudo BLFn1]CCN88484.1 putative TRAP-type transport system, large permease component, N-acetylneuraminate transporter [Vibrio nigripulchritudo SFn27]CCN95891.1 putative TRAP-type transport system, large permease component, N-acetylneuraminate transporter [Vibrio nigripulchritudo ENn2]CCO39220.1 putative TRAP-type